MIQKAHIVEVSTDRDTLPALHADNISLGSSVGHVHYSHRNAWLRAALLGANDGLVSTGSLILGIVAASAPNGPDSAILAGVSGLVAGAFSMAVGEYISVSSQRDSELADIKAEIDEHAKGPSSRRRELKELTQIYMERGLGYDLALQVAETLSQKDVIATHMREELGIDINELTNPWVAVFASLIAFTVGGVMPLIVVIAVRARIMRIILVSVVNGIVLIFFGAMGSYLGGAPVWKGAVRVLFGGALAMAATFGVGILFDTVTG